MKKRVLLTVNPQLVTGRRMMTQRSLVTALDPHAELLLATAGDYDFTRGLVRAYRRIHGGKFEEVGMVPPEADLWIVYSDGYYLDHRARGFSKRLDFFHAQVDFHQRQLESGRVGRVVNEPGVELRTLKSWLAGLDSTQYSVIPTRLFTSMGQVREFQKEARDIVAKPNWGGAGIGVHRLSNEQDVQALERQLAQDLDNELSDYCFQPYLPGDEKRMWFVGGHLVAARKSHGRRTPWSDSSPDYDVYPYLAGMKGFAADLEAAERLCRLSGLNVGSIDFIGDRINEINGAGTIFTEYKKWQRILDARPALVKHFVELVQTL